MWPLRSVVTAAALAASLPALAQTFESITLGAASNLTMFNMGATTFSASNSGTLFDGNIGLAAGSTTNFSGGGTLTGVLYKDAGATLQSNLGSQFNLNGGIVTQSMTQAVSDVRTASHDAALLAPTQTFTGNLSNGATFSSTGLQNVINIYGDISVSSPSKNLTFAGGADDRFIVNVFGSISVSNGMIGVAGGLTADHLLINVVGGGTVENVSLSNASSTLYGTYLDVDGKISLTPGTVYGAVMARQIQTSSGPKVYGDTFVSPVPEPETYAMLLTGLGLLGFEARRRRKLQLATA